MFKPWLFTVCLAAVGAAFLAPAGALGQSPYRYPYRLEFNRGQYPYYWSPLLPSATTTYPQPMTTGIYYQPRYNSVYYPGLGFSLQYEGTGSSSPLYNSFQSFAPPNPAPAAADANTVTIDVRLPDPNAEVWIDGYETKQKGASRQFVSPALNPGQSYRYEIKAKWTQNGKPVEQTQAVTVQAGHRVAVDFLAAAR
jgi:uncharacterized protein (TIGR03000 family)